MTYDLRLSSGASPGIFQNSAGYVYLNSRQSWHKRQYSYRGKYVKAFPPPVHNYQFSRSTASLYEQSSYNHGSQWMYGWRTGDSGSWMFDQVPFDYTRLYNALLDELTEKVRGSIDLSIDIAEAGQTARMLNATSHAESLFRGLTKLSNTKKLDGNTLIGALRFSGAAWLTWQLAIRPIIGTIYEAAEQANNVVLNALERFKVQKSVNYQASEYPHRVHTPTGYSVALTSSGILKHGLTIGLVLEPKGFDPSRWTSLNPVSIAWELMPLSFVCDWFIDVGSYIRNLETAVHTGTRFHGGYITEVQACDMTGRFYEADPWSWTTLLNSTVSSISVQRSILSSYPVPRFPTFDANLGSSRLLTAASLLAVLGLGRK